MTILPIGQSAMAKNTQTKKRSCYERLKFAFQSDQKISKFESVTNINSAFQNPTLGNEIIFSDSISTQQKFWCLVEIKVKFRLKRLNTISILHVVLEYLIFHKMASLHFDDGSVSGVGLLNLL